MSGAETSGSDIQKAATAFSDGADRIADLAGRVTESKVSPEKAGRKFHEAGQAYREALDKLGANVKAFAENGTKLSENLAESAKQYQTSDESGAEEIGKVEV